jgi:hypothetical protein
MKKRIVLFIKVTCKTTAGLPTKTMSICVIEVCIIRSIVCLTKGAQSLPKQVFLRVRSSASPFQFQYPLLSSRSFRNYVCPLPHFPSLSLPFYCTSIICFRRQFVLKLRPIQLAFFYFYCMQKILALVTLRNTFSFLTRSVQLIFSHPSPAPYFRILDVFLICFPLCPNFRKTRSYTLRLEHGNFLP